MTVIREPDYYAQQSQVLQTIIRSIGFGIAGLMGIGAIFGALNTMYTAVANRTREIATLRALGFGSRPGRGVGDGRGGAPQPRRRARSAGCWRGSRSTATRPSTMNLQSFSQVAFAFAVSPSLLARAACSTRVVMGLVGGLFPAIRAARLPIVTALRQL